METLGYVVGIVIHVVSKWAGWKAKSRSPWMAYWREYSAVNIVGFLAAIPLLFLWTSGALPEMLRLVGQAVVNGVAAVAGGTEFRCPTPEGFTAAMGAGFAMDSIARTVWMLFEGRRAERGRTR